VAIDQAWRREATSAVEMWQAREGFRQRFSRSEPANIPIGHHDGGIDADVARLFLAKRSG
jgi:hypothetical protein